MSNRLLAAVAAALAAGAASPAHALCRDSVCSPDGLQQSGAVYRLCLPEPSCWNGDLVVLAHGYVNSSRPVAIPEEHLFLADGASVPRLANALGYAFATTSYRTNGLAVREGVADVTDLVGVFAATHGRPGRTFLIGASEGGQVTALAVEQAPETFDGGLAACAPIGDFRAAIDHVGDFRVVFDYLFPGVLPGSIADVPWELKRDWAALYEPRVREALLAHPDRRAALFEVTGAAHDRAVPGTQVEGGVSLLTHAVFASSDADARLGGSPFENTSRVYAGSPDDAALNAGVGRYAASEAALAQIAAGYETSGALARPLVTLHTRRDPLVPHRQSVLYGRKARAAGAGALHQHVPAFRYGHCAFKALDGLLAFATLVRRAGAPVPEALEAALTDRASRRRLLAHVRRPFTAHTLLEAR
jgi:hypothetical protein